MVQQARQSLCPTYIPTTSTLPLCTALFFLHSQVNFINTVSRGLKAGTVWVNCYNVYDAAVPFGE